jgi:3-hydroxyacyl-[acyl-carrier-protein] dehydratase
MNIDAILKMLPHRYPFLLIDRVLELEAGTKVVALKNVSINEPFFQGHFPGVPVFPGVLVIEAVAQACGIVALSANPDMSGRVVYLAAVDGFRFRKPVIPGDQLRITVEKIAEKRSIWKFQALVEVDGKKVAEGELMATIVDN